MNIKEFYSINGINLEEILKSCIYDYYTEQIKSYQKETNHNDK